MRVASIFASVVPTLAVPLVAAGESSNARFFVVIALAGLLAGLVVGSPAALATSVAGFVLGAAIYFIVHQTTLTTGEGGAPLFASVILVISLVVAVGATIGMLLSIGVRKTIGH